MKKDKFNYEADPFYNLFHVGSATECTGLESMKPMTTEEEKELAELYSIHPTGEVDPEDDTLN